MTFLGLAGGQIEVHLRKPPFDSGEAVYFEYEMLGNPHPPKHALERTRYIVPEDTTYAIEVTLKKEFEYDEKYIAVGLEVFDTASGARLSESLVAEKGILNVPVEDQQLLVTILSGGAIDGKGLNNVGLTMCELAVRK